MLHNVHEQCLSHLPTAPEPSLRHLFKGLMPQLRDTRIRNKFMVCFQSFPNVPIQSGLKESRRDMHENVLSAWKSSAYRCFHKDIGRPSRDLWNNLPFLHFPWSGRENSSLTFLSSACRYLIKGVNPTDFGRSCSPGGGVMGGPHKALSKLYQRNFRS